MTDDQANPSATVNQTTNPVVPTPASDAVSPLDDTSAPPSATTSPASPPAAQDPLAILESILQDAKNKSGQKKTQGDGAAQSVQPVGENADLVDGEPPPTEEELAIIKQQMEQEEAARTAELEAKRQQQIAHQQAILAQELPQTPQYQARQQQVAEEAQIKAASATADGYEITQLTKTKIPVQE